MAWLRWYAGTVNDAKWAMIARKTGINVPTVIAIWAALLEYASENEDRGSVSGFDPEEIDAVFGLADGTCAAVIEAMTSKGIIEDGRIAKWSKRQFDEKNVERIRRCREKKAEPEAEATLADTSAKCPGNDSEMVVKYSRNDSEMVAKRDEIPDTDTDTDTDSDTEQNKVKRCIPLTGYVSSASPEDATPSAEVIPKMPLSQARKTPECPHERIIALYHEILPEMNPVKVWNETRQKLLRARWREDPARQNLDWWRDYFLLVRASDFLMGKRPGKGGGAPFMADLEWIIRPCNMAKILEGRYSNGDRKRRDITQMSYEEAKAATGYHSLFDEEPPPADMEISAEWSDEDYDQS